MDRTTSRRRHRVGSPEMMARTLAAWFIAGASFVERAKLVPAKAGT
jgi:hypothetical protein